MEEEQSNYKPVDQLYIAKQTGNANASQWQVDTTKIRNYLESKLRGIRESEKEYRVYQLLVNEQLVTDFLALNEEEAEKHVGKYASREDIDFRTIKIRPTQETEIKVVRERINEPLLPDDVIDNILAPVETTFSQVGYLTRYEEQDIKDELFRNISAIRSRLFEIYHERADMKSGNFELIINLIWNMMKQVLKASHQGFTAKGIREKTQEKMVTHNPTKKNRAIGL